MEQTVDVGYDGAEFTDKLTGDKMYQMFVKKQAAIPYNKQEYCPDNENFKRCILPDYRIFLERLGVTREDLDALSCIHVAGTKGKGSTCAMTERILRTYGYKTGFISSPPLLEIRERVRINGVPVSRAMFGRYGMECFHLLEKNKMKCGQTFTDTPGPYGIFTLVAYYILVKEKVDVAVVEVGLGGEYDTTNVLWSPTVTGVSSLAIEHVSLLGDTLGEITWHKAGIFKDGRPAFTVIQQEEAMKVLVQRADERNAPLQICPPLVEYECHGNRVKLGLAGKHQRSNASLVIQLTKTWLEEKAPERFRFQAIGPHNDKCDDVNSNTTTEDELIKGKVRKTSAFVLPVEFLQGFELSKWPGRNQTVRKKGVTYYLDNAHTKESVAFCKSWFEEEAYKEAQLMPGIVKTVLIFNLSGDRDATKILPPLVEYGFDAVVFSVLRTVATQENEVRDYKVSLTLDEQLLNCQKHLATFKQLYDDMCKGFCNNNSVISSKDERCQRVVKPIPIFKVSPSALDAIRWVVGPRLDHDDDMVNNEMMADGEEVSLEADHLQVLVTGSNFMVGSVIHVIEPNMLDEIDY